MSEPAQYTIVSDAHGCYFTLLRLLAKIPDVGQLVFNGDLVDRGPHSRQVVEFAMERKIPTVTGNHESLLLQHHGRFHSKICDDGAWLFNGGMEALKSWHGGDLPKNSDDWRVPDGVVDWIAALPEYLIYGDLLVSHAGHALTKRGGEPAEMRLWWRDTHFPKDGYYRTVGHTPVEKAVVGETFAQIDTGAAYTDRGYGTMTAFQWPSKRVYTQKFDETPL